MTTLAAASLFASLFGFMHRDPGPPPPVWQPPTWPARPAKPVVITKPGTYDYRGTVRVLGKIPDVVKEYGTPSIHVRSDRVTVKDFAWRGSMEGAHAGSETFDPHGMRRHGRPVRVTFDGLCCDDIGEDCVEIQPRSRIIIRNSRFRGNYRLMPNNTRDLRGLDKVVQIDCANVTFEHCDFFNGVCCIRAKANSHVVAKDCRFIDCSTCASGDGLACPRPSNLYDNGQPGLSQIKLINCEAWNCRLFARAYTGCEIELIDCTTHNTPRLLKNDGGSVKVFRTVLTVPPARK